MDFWMKVLLSAHVLLALSIIGLVLIQHGKGADMGSGFGGGASGSLFGATGSANFLSRSTAVLATAGSFWRLDFKAPGSRELYLQSNCFYKENVF